MPKKTKKKTSRIYRYVVNILVPSIHIHAPHSAKRMAPGQLRLKIVKSHEARFPFVCNEYLQRLGVKLRRPTAVNMSGVELGSN